VGTDVPFKALVFAASIHPLIIPGILYTIAWIFLASPDIGLINRCSSRSSAARVDIFTVWGMIWVEGCTCPPSCSCSWSPRSARWTRHSRSPR